MRRWLVAIVASAIVCTIFDHFHATTGVLWYPRPDVWSQSWWVPLLFGSAALVGMLLVEPLRRVLDGEPLPAPTRARLFGDIALFAGAYGATSLFHQWPTALTVGLLLAWLARVAVGPRWLIGFSLVSAVAGPLFEATFSALGFFYYHRPDFLGVERWLPALYLHVGVMIATASAAVRAPALAAPTPRHEPRSARAPSGT